MEKTFVVSTVLSFPFLPSFSPLSLSTHPAVQVQYPVLSVCLSTCHVMVLIMWFSQNGSAKSLVFGDKKVQKFE